VDLQANPLSILLHSWPAHIDIFVLRDVVLNIAIYVPAGLTGHLAFRKFGRMWLSLTAPVVICTIVSASIEMIQLFVPSRNTSCLDLVTNAFGSLLGVILAASLEEVIEIRSARLGALSNRRKPADRSALVMLVCWVAWLWFPLIPIFGRTILRQKLALFHAAPWNGVQFASAAMVWFAAGTLFLASSIRPARWLPLIASLLVAGQLFISGEQPSPSELAGALAGAILWILFWPKRKIWRDGYRRVQAWAFVLIVLVRGLVPFSFSSAVNTFLWIPFDGFLETEWQNGVRLVLEKFFWYGLAFWLLKKSGMRPWIAAILVSIVLLSIEIAQTHLPGRTSEITDPLLGLFAAGVLTVLSRGPQPVES
jgi:VanZ family protein